MWIKNNRLACSFLLYFFSLSCVKTKYEGGVVLRVDLKDEQQARKFVEISNSLDTEIDKWSETDIFVPDVSTKLDIMKKLQENIMSYSTVISDVGRLLEDVEVMNQEYEKRTRSRRSVNDNSLRSDVVGRYATYEEIMEWLRRQALLNKDIMSLHTIGSTYEKRDLVLVKLGPESNIRKPAFWIDFGIHAREWITPATATYIIQQFLHGWQAGDKEISSLLDEVDFYLLPVTNPDGYVYTHVEDRMWRKNRSPDYNNSGCLGTDLNRNFDYHWGEAMSSSNQCVGVFRGPTPESEPETIAIDDAVRALGARLKVFLTVHSYSQLWMTGWSYTNRTSDNHEEEMAVAQKAVDAIYKTTKSVYKAGPSPSLLYKYSGGSPDWAKGVAGVKYAFCVELRDTGNYGFLLPADQILDTGAELFAAVRAVGEHIAQEAKDDSTYTAPHLEMSR